ncbi:hypothetical protein MD484_g3819, partial [Candolleomyces efflorescens]
MGGAATVNAFAILCTLALLSVALRLIWLAIRSRMAGAEEKPHVYMFFQTQLGNYALCLLLAMTCNTFAGILALPWLIARGITIGTACTTQAVLTQIGTWSSGYFTVTIAIHTFMSLVLKRGQSLLLSRCAMAFGWILAGVIAGLPFFLSKPNGAIYGPDGLMCGIRSAYAQLRFFLHLLPILVASVLSAIFYSVIFLVLRGTIVLQGGIRLSLDPTERWNGSDDSYNRFLARVARSMVWYPVAYVALLVPYAITRLLQVSGYPVPFQALIFACVCWFMLGVVNVGLLYNTFRVLGPALDEVMVSVILMSGADMPSRAPRTLFTFNSKEDIKQYATGCDGDIGGYSTVHLDLDENPEHQANTGKPATENQMELYRERVRSIGISILGGNSGVSGKYELGIDSIRAVNEEDLTQDPLSNEKDGVSEEKAGLN